MVTSMAKCVVDHDICTSVSYFLQGIPISKETLMEEVISSIGPGGNFMITDHTAASIPKSLFITPMRTRNLDPKTLATSRSYLSEEAYKHAKKVLASH